MHADEPLYLPIKCYASHLIKTGLRPHEQVFLSSGTTSTNRSQHAIDSLQDYYRRCQDCFEELNGSIDDYVHLAFLPFYQKNRNSSLIYMIDSFVKRSSKNGSKFITQMGDLKLALDGINRRTKTIVWTVTYGLIDFANAFPGDYERVTFIETGGMKGRRKEQARSEIHGYAKTRLEGATISSEYGMCELSSQAYFKKGRFYCPKGMTVAIRDIYDPKVFLPSGKRGIICVADLYNIQSCCFIETEDLGIKYEDGGFEIIGRLDQSAVRGCNLMYEHEPG